MSYNSSNQAYHQKLTDYEKTIAEFRRLSNKHERLRVKYEERAHRTKYPHWIENILEPLAQELTSQFLDSHFSTAGPFGMCNETSISIYGKENNLLAFLQFVPDSEHNLNLRDYSVDTHRFGHGSIAQMNGMNHPDIPIPKDATIHWFLDMIKYFDRTIEKWDSAKVTA